MTKKELEKYNSLRNSINHQRRRQKVLQRKLESRKESLYVVDSVNDYRTGKAHPLKITGYVSCVDGLENCIDELNKKILEDIKKSEQALLEIEEFIQGQDDPLLREVLRCKYLDGLTWEEVGRENYISSDYARQIVRKIIKRN